MPCAIFDSMWRHLQLAATSSLILIGASCGKTINHQMAESINKATPPLKLKATELEILETRESGNSLVAEVKVKTALKFVKENGRWELTEVRLADRHWEKISHILALLNEKRTQTTMKSLEDMAEAIRLYQVEQGYVPQATDFRALIDLLAPRFLNSVIRLDAWSNPFLYSSYSSSGYKLSSAGADGAEGSRDDIVFEVIE